MMEGDSSLFLAENFQKEGRHGDTKQGDLEPGGKMDKITNLDLELAAEIGKVLLEKNRELELLLRDSQDYIEEEILKAQFFEQQVETLRESLQNQTKAYEHLEAHNHELADSNTQLKSDCKAANSKIKRLWETIESLEKKCESYKLKIDLFEEEKLLLRTSENEERSVDVLEAVPTKTGEMANDSYDEEIQDLMAKCEHLEEKVRSSQEVIRDMRVQMNLDSIEKEELKAEIEDISTDNQLLQHRLSSLEAEIEEWQAFAKKAKKYKQLADRYSSNVDVSFTSSVPRISLQNTKRNNYDMAKSSSHEVLSNSPLCEPFELLATKRHISSSVSQLNQPLKNLSVLSEMDNQYHDLVKRYEKLLDNYDNHDETEKGKSRAQKVQRAIQTLSWDFSAHDAEHKCLSPEQKSNSSENIQCGIVDENVHLDFRKMFVEIFAKLKATKEFDPDTKIRSESD